MKEHEQQHKITFNAKIAWLGFIAYLVLVFIVWIILS